MKTGKRNSIFPVLLVLFPNGRWHTNVSVFEGGEDRVENQHHMCHLEWGVLISCPGFFVSNGEAFAGWGKKRNFYCAILHFPGMVEFNSIFLQKFPFWTHRAHRNCNLFNGRYLPCMLFSELCFINCIRRKITVAPNRNTMMAMMEPSRIMNHVCVRISCE